MKIRRYEGNITCITCKKSVPKMNSNHKYCDECANDKHRDTMRRYMAKKRQLDPDGWKKYQGRYKKTRKVVNGVRRINGKKVVCLRCHKLKVHEGKGLCYKCYSDWHNECVRGTERKKVTSDYSNFDSILEP